MSNTISVLRTWQLAYKRRSSQLTYGEGGYSRPFQLREEQRGTKPPSPPSWPNSTYMTGKVSRGLVKQWGLLLVPNRKNSVSQIWASQQRASLPPTLGARTARQRVMEQKQTSQTWTTSFQALEQSGGLEGHPDLTSGEERNLSVLKD